MSDLLDRIEANHRDAPQSTGLGTDQGEAARRDTVLHHGKAIAGLIQPDPLDIRFDQYREEMERRFPAGDAPDRALIEQAALALARIAQLRQIERDERQVVADRAASCWDLDRAAEAEALGARLGRNPACLLAELKRTAPGCAWLIARWEGLAEAARRLGPWDAPRRRLAANLLGLPAELRDADHRLSPDRPAEAQIALAQEQLDSLRTLKAEVLDGLEVTERLLAATGRSFASTPAGRRLRRSEAGLFRRLTWVASQLNALRPRTPGRPASPLPTFPVPERPVRPRRSPLPFSSASPEIRTDDRMPPGPPPAGSAPSPRRAPSSPSIEAPPAPMRPATASPSDRPARRPSIDPRIARALAAPSDDHSPASPSSPTPARSDDDRRSPAPPLNRRSRRAAAALARKHR